MARGAREGEPQMPQVGLLGVVARQLAASSEHKTEDESNDEGVVSVCKKLFPPSVD